MRKVNRYSPEVRQRAVRLLAESLPSHNSEWAATVSVAEKIGCTPEMLRQWARQRQGDRGQRSGASSEQQERLRPLERENRALRRADELWRKASAQLAHCGDDCPTGRTRSGSSTTAKAGSTG